MSIVFYHCEHSRGMRPIWTAEELGLEYSVKMLPFPPRVHRKDFLKIIGLLALNFLILGCSIGTSFKSNEIRSFKGTIIPELSSQPILIEKESIDLIKKEKNQ